MGFTDLMPLLVQQWRYTGHLDQGFSKRKELNCTYRADCIYYNEVLVELKSVSKMGVDEEAQIINYLKATGLKRGLLINFGDHQLSYKRFVV